jgi:hypothetical protein
MIIRSIVSGYRVQKVQINSIKYFRNNISSYFYGSSVLEYYEGINKILKTLNLE